MSFSDPLISIYAELLPNIGTISLVCTLPSPSDLRTTVLIENGTHLLVSHQGETARIEIPTNSVKLPVIRLPLGTPGKTLLSWRLPSAHGASRRTSGESGPPWEARALPAGGEVRCRQCGDGTGGQRLVAKGRIKEWKDLPSENWAEMMEFWHCHKPGDDEHGHGHGNGHEAANARGYGSDAAIGAQEGVGLVDLTTFLFSEEDCEGVMFSQTTFDKSTDKRSNLADFDSPTTLAKSISVFCRHCRSQLGYFNTRTNAVTLFKWCVAFASPTTTNNTPSPLPSLQSCLTSSLLAGMTRSGLAKCLLLPICETALDEPTETRLLHLQVLNGGLTFASTHHMQGRAMPAVKLLYRFVDRPEAEAMLESVTSDVHDVNVPPAAIRAVVHALEKSAALLPAADREFRGVPVGLLERWHGARLDTR